MSCCGAICVICLQKIAQAPVSVEHKTSGEPILTCYCQPCWNRHTQSSTTCPDCRQVLPGNGNVDTSITKVCQTNCTRTPSSVIIDNKTLAYEVTDTIGDVMRAFAVHAEVDATSSYLEYNNIPLSVTETIGSYEIPNGETLKYKEYPFQVYIRYMGTILSLFTGPWETIEALRFKIWNKYHKHVREQWLVLPNEPWVGLHDDRTLFSYEIGNIHDLEFRPKHITNQKMDSWATQLPL
jgi:hypothetical protein